LPGIFISYRRSDTPDAVGRIYDRLVSEFGKARVFKDVDSIPLGQDFRGHLNDIVGGCAAVLAIIGPKWTDIRNEAGQKRLEDPDDFVRIELEAALARNVPVVPVLVGHAPMPGTSQLPSTLSSLAFRQSIEVRPDPDFHNDATRLVSALKAIIDPNAANEVAATGSGPGQGATVHPAQPNRSWVPWLLAAATTLAAIAFAIPALKYLRLTPPPESRIAITLPVRQELGFALSPDGRQIVYTASGDNEFRLWLVVLSTTTAQPLPGTEGGSAPFWSPDGRSIGFFAAGSLKRMDIGGGQPQTLATQKPGSKVQAGVWSTNGDILFTSGPGQPVARITSTGGPVKEVTKSGPKDTYQVPLSVLPDGQHFLFVVAFGKSDGIYLGTLEGSPPVRLSADVGPVAWLPSGWMVWLPLDLTQGTPKGSLMAQRLNLRNAKLTGGPVSIAGGVGSFTAAATGLVAYETARVAGPLQLTWVDRSGKELGTVGDADDTLRSPRVAPDGRRIVVSRVAQGNRDLWLLDGARTSRMTFDAGDDTSPVWSPDGLRITFASNRSGSFTLYDKLANGAGGEQSFKTSGTNAFPCGWSADGKLLLYFSDEGSPASADIGVLPKFGDRKPFAILQSPFVEVWGQVSPDGRWVAYQSNESGTFEVFVRSFNPSSTAENKEGSNVAEDQWMVSTAGGISPKWSADGMELFFLNRAGEMMAAPIKVDGSAIVPGTPIKLFDAHVWGGGIDNQTGRQFDVAPDGRFLINRTREMDATPTITLLQNWNPDAHK
jgi:Tol biopolymer transport system component